MPCLILNSQQLLLRECIDIEQSRNIRAVPVLGVANRYLHIVAIKK